MDGQDGADGQDGFSILIEATTSSCSDGGSAYNIGQDTNYNGVLEPSEVMSVFDICNGATVLRDHKGRLDLKDLPEMMVQMETMVLMVLRDHKDRLDHKGLLEMMVQMVNQVLMVKMVLRDHKDRLDLKDLLEMMVPMETMVLMVLRDTRTGWTSRACWKYGADGAPGADGLTALVNTTTESAGANCANGGTRIDVGIDDNMDGQLQPSEIDSTEYICNGIDASSSPNTWLIDMNAASYTADCPFGERVHKHGLDNGAGDEYLQMEYLKKMKCFIPQILFGIRP